MTQSVEYGDEAALQAVTSRLSQLPPLVTSAEVETLKGEIAEAQEGRRFILVGGDCAETLTDCRDDIITSKLKILLQMSLILVHASQRPVTRIGRFAGQYAKPRSQPTEERTDGEGQPRSLPSYFGDLVNRAEFTKEARTPDPILLLEGYKHAALTLNFIRSLSRTGFADIQHLDNWDLSSLGASPLPEELQRSYRETSDEVRRALGFMSSFRDLHREDLTKVEFFTSHEALNLEYEAAQTRRVPRREGWYCLTTHLPWIGERTRNPEGAHVEFCRGLENPIGVKIGPNTAPADLSELLRTLNPDNEPGKIVLITRLGDDQVANVLPPLIRLVAEEGHRVLWMCDPMHGNTEVTTAGRKTRSYDRVLREISEVIKVHRTEGTWFGGVHFELTGDDVTECIGGAAGITESDLDLNYATACDPRLNYRQALEMAFALAREMKADISS